MPDYHRKMIYSPDFETIVREAIYKRLKDEKKTQIWLAKRLGISPQQLNAALTGRGNKPIKNYINKIAAVFQVKSVKELTGGVYSDPRETEWVGLYQDILTSGADYGQIVAVVNGMIEHARSQNKPRELPRSSV